MKFKNLPQQPFTPEDSQERLKKIVEQGRAKQQIKSRLSIAREEATPKTVTQPEASVQTSTNSRTEQTFLEAKSKPGPGVTEVRSGPKGSDREKFAQPQSQLPQSMEAGTDQPTPPPQQPTEAKPSQPTVEFTKLDPQTAEYWQAAWQQYINGSTVMDEEVQKVILEILLPQDNEIEIGAAEQMYAGMAGLGKKPGFVFNTLVSLFPKLEIFFRNPDNDISFELVADEKSIRFWVVVRKDWVEYMQRQIHGAYPEAEIKYAAADYFLHPEGVAAFHELSLKGRQFYPIRVFEDFEVDPLNTLTSVLSKLQSGERIILQVLAQPAGDAWRKQGQRFIVRTQLNPDSEKGSAPTIPQEVLEGVQEKIKRPGFHVVVRVLVESLDKMNAESIMQTVKGAFDQYSLPHLAMFKTRKKKTNHKLTRSFMTRSFPRWGNFPVLNTTELATLYHFPSQEVKTPRIKWLKSRKAPPPTDMPEEGIYLGKSEFRNTEVEVRLQREDRRRHLYIVGQTGSGKSELMKFLAHQDVVNGKGIAFIDPHGETVEELMQTIPKERAEDVIYFNPADTDRPMGLNILEAKNEEAKHRAINSFIALLYKLYDPNRTGMVGPQLERAVRNVMLTAMAEEGNTLIEVLKLLTDPKFAKKKIPLIDDPLVKSYWTEQIAQTSDFHKSETLGYFVSKFDRFVTEKLMRNIIGQPDSAFDFREVMDKQKILLVNLSKGKIGEENSNFLGLLLIPRILMAAMSRADMPPEQRKDFYLYVDEFQNFSTPDFVQILSEARKYRLGLTVANQFLSQIDDEIRNAVFGNVGTMVSFRVGPDDAEYLEKQFEPVFTQKDLINQKVGDCVTRLLIGGQPSRPFSFRTDWPKMQAVPRSSKVAEFIEEISRLKYGRDRKVVENEINVRAGFD